MQIILMAAIGKNGELGYDNALLWHLPGDLPRFKQMTTGFPIIMGRKTFNSIGKALPERKNIVLSSDSNWRAVDTHSAHSIETALELAHATQKEKAFIIGGGQIYSLFLSYATTLELTEVNDTPMADTFFPNFCSAQFKEVQRISNPEHTPSFDYVTYHRV